MRMFVFLYKFDLTANQTRHREGGNGTCMYFGAIEFLFSCTGRGSRSTTASSPWDTSTSTSTAVAEVAGAGR